MIIVIQLLHVLLLSIRPFTVFPEFYIFPYLTSHGLIPYRQIIDQHVPSLLLSPLNFYQLGFRDLSSFKILFIIVILLQSVLLAHLARKVTGLKISSHISALIFALLQPFIGGNAIWYDTLTPLATLPAGILLLSQRFVLAGLFLGAALVMKQTLVLLCLGLVIYIGFLFGIKKMLTLLAGMSIIPLALFGSLYHASALEDFFHWAILFNFTTYSQLASIYPSKEILFIGISFICITGFFFFKLAKNWQHKIIALICLGASIGGLSRLDVYHFHGSVPFISLMLAAIVIYRRRLSIFVAALLLIIIFFDHRHPPHNYEDLAISSVVAAVQSHTSAGDKIFLLGAQPHIYALSNTVPAGDLFYFQMPWYLVSLQDRQLAALRASPPKLIVYDPSSSVDAIPIQDSAAKLIDFLNSQYHPVDQVGMYTLYSPNP